MSVYYLDTNTLLIAELLEPWLAEYDTVLTTTVRLSIVRVRNHDSKMNVIIILHILKNDNIHAKKKK
jgi:hypothetical protein